MQAAGAIHTDFERGFICAEVMAYDVLHELKTESEVKGAGKYRQEGKNYVVQVGLQILQLPLKAHTESLFKSLLTYVARMRQAYKHHQAM